MREYADYFPEVVGGSWIGRACESAPLDLALLGDDRRPAWWFPAVPPLEGGYPAVLLADHGDPTVTRSRTSGR